MAIRDNSAWQLLRSEILKRALQTGTFTLASGKGSPYYLNFKKLQTPAVMGHIGQLMLPLIDQVAPDAIGGMETGGIVLSSALLTYGGLYGTSRFQKCEGFYVRKQVKGYGTNQRIEGIIKKDARVVLLEDVTTTGASIMDAAVEVEKEGGKVIRIITVVDRQEGAKDLLKKYDFVSLFEICDLLEPGLKS